jgi:hypothetical protein
MAMLGVALEDCYATYCMGCRTKPSKDAAVWPLTESLRQEIGLTDPEPQIIVFPQCRACKIEFNQNAVFRDQIVQTVLDRLRGERLTKFIIVIADPDLEPPAQPLRSWMSHPS